MKACHQREQKVNSYWLDREAWKWAIMLLTTLLLLLLGREHVPKTCCVHISYQVYCSCLLFGFLLMPLSKYCVECTSCPNFKMIPFFLRSCVDYCILAFRSYIIVGLHSMLLVSLYHPSFPIPYVLNDMTSVPDKRFISYKPWSGTILYRMLSPCHDKCIGNVKSAMHEE